MAYRKKATRSRKTYRAPARKKAARARPREQTIKLVLQHQMLAPPTAPLMQNNSLSPSKTKQPKL